MLGSLVLTLAAVRAAEPLRVSSQGLTIARIEGELDIGTQALVHRAIQEAKGRGDTLVIDLETPGGEVMLMTQIGREILDAPSKGVPTAAWVHDHAWSAGSLLVLACERVYMRPQGTIGSALPVQFGPGGPEPVSEDPAVREKYASAMRTEFRAFAGKNGRPPLLAEAMVDPDVEVLQVNVDGELRLVSTREYDDLTLGGKSVLLVKTVDAKGQLFAATGSEAVELGLADGLADSIQELSAKLGLATAVRTEVLRTRSEDLATWLDKLMPLLLVAGFVLLYLELKTPGLSVAGILSLACFGAVLFGRYLVGLADVPHFVLILVGAALLAVELFLVPGTVWVGLLGGVLFLAGLVWALAGGSIALEYELDRVILIEQASRLLLAGLLALLVIWGLSRILPHTPVLSRMVLAPSSQATGGAMPETADSHARVARVGAAGRALTALRPVGKVALDEGAGLEFEARAEGAEIQAGARVAVIEVQASGRLVVAPRGEAS